MENSQVPEVPGFAVGRLLGSGGSASVWLAREQRTGRDFAVKCFRSGLGGPQGADTMTEDAVRREIRILSVLDHPHLVKAHDAVRLAGVPEGGAALVMDYAAGGSLAALVASRGRLGIGETVTVLTPIAQVLGYLHSKGFTHADVSPGNVLFTGQGKPMLSDVGIARMLGDPGSAASAGTPGFADPAPMDAVRGLQPERDVYATAAIGWFCLTGQAPPRTADRPPLALLVPDVPPDLAAALEAGLNEDRRGRPTAEALATAVYRSASPRPLDLAASVHPTVIPELLTRRRLPAASRTGTVREKFRAAGRWISTAKWGWLPFAAQPMPFPQPEDDLHPPGRKHAGKALGKHAGKVPGQHAGKAPGKHAGKVPGQHAGKAPGRGSRGSRLLRRILPAGAVAAAAVTWFISGSGGLPTGSTPAPDSVIAQESKAAKEASVGQEASIAQESKSAQEFNADPAAAARQRARAPDPVLAVRGLAALRDLAFSTGDLGLLGEVNVEGSPAAIIDERTAERLRSSGHVLAGFSSTLADLRAEEDGATATQAVVRVHSGSSAYEEKDAQGAIVATGSAGSSRPLRIMLVAVDGTWRINEILPGD